ncbi:MAG TPA: ABC transporter permease [Candidatus Methylomirabilis sp.]|nr:ABC transporter permease [Candidatus Methylomirabilis sp.]
MGILWQDVRYGLRMLAKAPGFTAIATLTLALGIGANTAIFSAVNGILLKPLPYANASRLVSITGYKQFPNGIMATMDFSADVWKRVREQTSAIEALGLYQNKKSVTLTSEAVPEIVAGVRVSSDFFSVLGARPLIGRPILAGDTQPGAKPVAVVSYALWHATWGGDSSLVGRSVMLDDESYTVVGVMPAEFEFPLYEGPKGIWLPLIITAAQAGKENVESAMAVARLKKGMTIGAANTELKTVSERLSTEFTGFSKGGYFNASGLQARLGDLDNELLILLGAVGFVLLIACVNVSELLLAHGWARQKEVAIREALGASRSRILRQFLTESVLLALAGGALGMVLSVWGVHVLRAITPPDAPEHGQFRLDANVLWFTLAVSLLTGVLFGLAPGMQASARQVGTALRENLVGPVRGLSGTRARRLRSGLAVVEIALAVVLVVGATLTARSFAKLIAVKLGFRTDHIVTMKANFSKSICGAGQKGEKLASCQLAVGDALGKMRGLPGVESAAVVSTVPLEAWSITASVQIEGQPKEASLGGGEVIADRLVSPGYFRAMGIRLLGGRDFEDKDTANSGRLAIVDETFARKYLGDHPLGRRISSKKDNKGNPEWMEIVGVVSDVHDLSPQEDPRPEIYIPFQQASYFREADFVVRSTASPLAVAPEIKRAIWAVDKNAPITDLATMDQIVAQSVAEPKFQMVLLGSFGALGLALAIVGIYGVISYGVTQRRPEIGVRMALGASRGDVLRMVIREGMLLASAGIVAGTGGALALTRFLRSLLFGIKPTDPATFVGVTILLALTALAACWLPARRATNVDPMEALRHQ